MPHSCPKRPQTAETESRMSTRPRSAQPSNHAASVAVRGRRLSRVAALGRLAMQKVEGSSPFIRFQKKSPGSRAVLCSRRHSATDERIWLASG